MNQETTGKHYKTANGKAGKFWQANNVIQFARLLEKSFTLDTLNRG